VYQSAARFAPLRIYPVRFAFRLVVVLAVRLDASFEADLRGAAPGERLKT